MLPSDFNILLITLLSRPRVSISSLKICLPGIAANGFLEITVDYASPDIATVFVSTQIDNPQKIAEMAWNVSHEMKIRNLLDEITKHIKRNFIEKIAIIPNGSCFTL